MSYLDKDLGWTRIGVRVRKGFIEDIPGKDNHESQGLWYIHIIFKKLKTV